MAKELSGNKSSLLQNGKARGGAGKKGHAGVARGGKSGSLAQADCARNGGDNLSHDKRVASSTGTTP